jgi:hypothetical protein
MWSKKHNWFELKIKRIIELKIHGSNHVLKNILDIQQKVKQLNVNQEHFINPGVPVNYLYQ